MNDASHEIVGTEFNQYCDYHDEPYQNYLARNLSPSINFSFQEDEIDGKRVVVLMIPAATEKEETFIKNLGLRTVEGEYNLLAQLLSDDSHIPLRVSIFSGKTKGSKLFSVREFGNNCLLYTLDELSAMGM